MTNHQRPRIGSLWREKARVVRVTCVSAWGGTVTVRKTNTSREHHRLRPNGRMLLAKFLANYEPMNEHHIIDARIDSLSNLPSDYPQARASAPPLSPATPSAEIDRCTCGHTKALHDGPDHEGECVHEDAGHRFCPCEIFVPKAAPATPSVTVEEAVASAVAELWRDVTDRRDIKRMFTSCDPDVQDEIRAAWAGIVRRALSLPRAPAKDPGRSEEKRCDPNMTQLVRCYHGAILGHCDTCKALRASPRSAVEAEVVERCAKKLAEMQAELRERARSSVSLMLNGDDEQADALADAEREIRALARANAVEAPRG